MQTSNEKKQAVGSRAIVRAFFEKLTWLGLNYEESETKKIKLKVVDYDVLSFKINPSDKEDDLEVKLFTYEGYLVGTVGFIKIKRKGFFNWFVPESLELVAIEESIMEAVCRIQESQMEPVYYVIGYYFSTQTLIIGKPRDGKTIKECFDDELQHAKSIVAAMLK